jgi:tetratricopeptide (TPR) repeat protein
LQLLIDGWTKSLYNLPFLLVLVLDHPHPLHDSTPHEQESEWLRWLRQVAAPYASRTFPTLHVGSLRRHAVEALLSAESAAYATELHSLTAGVPALLRELLRHWEQQGLAHQQPAGRWHLDAHSLEILPGALYERTIEAPLHACAARAQALGFDVTAEILLDWLNYAVWEGDAFTDEALAQAVGQAGDALEDFRELLDEVLTRSEDDPQSETLLVELDDLIILPTAELDRPQRGLVRYRFDPPLLARILYWRQSDPERTQRGPRYIQALTDAYHPFAVQIAPLLIDLAQRLGRHADAARFQELIAPPADLDRAQLLLATLRTLATDPPGQQHFVRTVLDFFDTFNRKAHPRPFIPLLEEAANYAHTLQQTHNQARLLTNLGLVYTDLGEMARALTLHNQALLLMRQVGNIQGEAYNLTYLGNIYSKWEEKAQALTLHNQALPLMRQASDLSGEAYALTNLGLVYADLHKMDQALRLHNQALALRRQVGDIGGEAYTLTNLGTVYAYLGEMDQALLLHNQALALRRQVGDITGEADALTNLGLTYSQVGQNEQALALHNQALLLMRQIGDIGGEAATLYNLGYVYANLEKKEQALALFNQALPLVRQVGDINREARALGSMGNIYLDLEKKEQALALFNQALPLMRQVNDIGGEASILAGLANS